MKNDSAGFPHGTISAALIFAMFLLSGCASGPDAIIGVDNPRIPAESVSGGAGIGANYLTGGFNKKISLQPYSVEGKKGFGLELGGQRLQLNEIAQTN